MEGYYEVAEDGGVFAFGQAPFRGSMGGQSLQALMVGMARTYDSQGYWEVGADGGIFAFSAPFNGSAGSINLSSCVQGMGARSNGGYWLVAADGGIFAYNAPFYGSMGGQPLAARIQGMSPRPQGDGYWEVGADGGVFAFGGARFLGSLAGSALAPVMSIAATPSGNGYWLLEEDGTVVGFGDAPVFGSAISNGSPAVSIAPSVNGDGYWVIFADGGEQSFGNTLEHSGIWSTINRPVAGSAGLHGQRPDFTLAAVPSATVVPAGSSGNVTITVGGNPYFQGNVSLSVSAPPSGSSASLSPTSLSINKSAGTSTLTIRRGLTQLTAFTLTVTACGNNVCHTVNVTVN
jgi:hypothetical protein